MFQAADDMSLSLDNDVRTEAVCLLYHQKKDFISVLYEPKDADYLKDKMNYENRDLWG